MAVPATMNLTAMKPRQWLAELTLVLVNRDKKTVLLTNRHYGPLRVQRPFYPERSSTNLNAATCCHIYLLHPPGGLVLGDKLKIHVTVEKNTNTLITTPSAGKIYGVQHNTEEQQQNVYLEANAGACLEWLPQETITFDGANARLSTQLKLKSDAKALIWDIVCLGRPAANERFTNGRCHQTLEVWQDERLILLERNRFEGGSALLKKPWGLKGSNTSGTLCATAKPSRDFIDNLLEKLTTIESQGEHSWGITQKGELFIARYMGDSSAICREGFSLIWQTLRPQLNGEEAVAPRIWNT